MGKKTVEVSPENSLSILDEMLIKLQKTVFFCRSAIGVYESLAEQFKTLKTYSRAFGLLQRQAQISLALDIFNIFDKSKHDEIVSIPHVISFISKNNIELKHEAPWLKGLKSLGVDTSKIKKGNGLEQLSLIRPNFIKDDALQLVENLRNSFIAHQSLFAVVDGHRGVVPTFIEIERLLNWAEAFIQVVYDGFFLESHAIADTKEHAKFHIENLELMLQDLVRANSITEK